MKENYQIRSVPRMFEQVAKQIADYIHSEDVTKGTKIPTERKLSELLEVSRSSVREGLRVLELLHFLESKQGEGTFVSEPPPFLLPYLVLKQPLDNQHLKNYYEIGIQTAQSIVIDTMHKNCDLPFDFHVLEGVSWLSFNQWIVALGRKLENPYFLSLWTDIYSLLITHNFFEKIAFSLDMESLLKAFYARDEQNVREFFATIKKWELNWP